MKSASPFERACVLAFVIYGLLSICVMMWKLPPFMGPDEPNHLKRANLVADGALVGQRFGSGSSLNSGGDTELNLDKAVRIFDPVKFNPSKKVTPDELKAAKAVAWGPDSALQGFSNTSVYPPLFYLPQSLGILVGKATGQSILSTLALARLLNALSCIVVGAFAVYLAGRARFFLMCVLLLPMSVELFSVVTQDGLIIAVSALACAFIVRAGEAGRPMTRNEILGAAVCIGMVGLTKPPYVLLAFILLFVQTERPKWRFAAFWGALLSGVAWNAWMAAAVQTPLVRKGVVLDQAGQVAFLLHHPLAVPGLVFQTMRAHLTEYMVQTIGDLGWLDTLLPRPYYALAYLVLVFAAAYGFRGVSRSGICVLVVLAVVFAAIFAGLYVAYTPVGSGSVDGVQGRYFLPLLALLPVAFMGGKKYRPPVWMEKPWVQQVAWAAVIAFPLISAFVTERALVSRYFGG